ncbi:hypothetical protein H5T88_07855 [bacterium]|nr:hypothetical protein [bacterium]
MKKAIFLSLFLSILAILPTGCGGDHKNDLGEVVAQYGQPEESQIIYTSSDETYLYVWYWTKGKQFTFKEESYVSMSGLSCEARHYWRKISEATFTPSPPKEERERLKRKLMAGDKE